MTAFAYTYQEDNLKLYGRAHQAKNSDLKYSTIIGDGRTILCRSRKNDDSKQVKPRFSEVQPCSSKATVVVTPTSSVAAAAAAGTVTTPTSSTTNGQAENTLYTFYYYQITGQDRNCNCYVCADLAEFKPKKQNDVVAAAAVGFATTTKEQPRRRAYA